MQKLCKNVANLKPRWVYPQYINGLRGVLVSSSTCNSVRHCITRPCRLYNIIQYLLDIQWHVQSTMVPFRLFFSLTTKKMDRHFSVLNRFKTAYFCNSFFYTIENKQFWHRYHFELNLLVCKLEVTWNYNYCPWGFVFYLVPTKTTIFFVFLKL